MNWFRKLMQGRYGVDQLSFMILIIYFILAILAMVLKNGILNIVSFIVLLICWFRIFSKQIYKRSRENSIFLSKVSFFTNGWKKRKRRFSQRKQYKFFTCKNCKQELRVPRGKGNIVVTCPKCKTKFDART